ncbi:MAG: hypothetical protein HQL66_05225 [Magnetococcales bacterium]|nr:hypothetical protein [Magnetococcales bacterium]
MSSLQSSARGLRPAPRSRTLAQPIDPEEAEQLLMGLKRSAARAASAAVSSSGARDGKVAPATVPPPGARDGTAVHDTLRALLGNAKKERLECMVPLIETLQMALALDRTKSGAPPGTLTVKGWLALLNSWEKQLQVMQPRQLGFSKSFVQEAFDKVTLEKSPLTSPLRELLTMMEAVKDRVAA